MSLICGIFEKSWTHRKRKVEKQLPRGWEKGEKLVKVYNLSALRWVRSDWMMMVTIANNTIFYNWNLPRTYMFTEKKTEHMWSDRQADSLCCKAETNSVL